MIGHGCNYLTTKLDSLTNVNSPEVHLSKCYTLCNVVVCCYIAVLLLHRLVLVVDTVFFS